MKKDRRCVQLLLALLIPGVLFFGLPGQADDKNQSSGNSFNVVLGPAAKKQRVLPFPKDYSLGEVMIIDWPRTNQSKEMRGAARGTVVVPPGKMSKLVPAYHYYKNPDIVKTLPPDGFDCILLAASSLADSEDGLCDRALSYVGHFKGLVELDLDRSDATDLGVAHAAELPNLQKITAFSAAIEGKCFKQLGGLRQLRQLRLPRNPIKDENLRYIGALPELESLSLTRCNISDAGIKHLANCSKLVSLNIADNPLITDQSIKYLLTMKKLRYLFIQDTSITAKGIVQLKAMPIEQLDLPPRNCTSAQLNELRKAFPHLKIAAPTRREKNVDSETKSLFAPLH